MKVLTNLISKLSILLLAISPVIILSCGSDMDKFQYNNSRDYAPGSGTSPGLDLYEILVTNDPLLQEAFGDIDEHEFSQYVYDFMPELYEDMGMSRKYLLNFYLRTYFLLDPDRINEIEGGWWLWDREASPAVDIDIETNGLFSIMQELHSIIERINDQDALDDLPENVNPASEIIFPDYPEYPYNPILYRTEFSDNFYSFMDVLAEGDVSLMKHAVDLLKKSMYYANDTYGLGYDTYDLGWKGFDSDDDDIPDTLFTIEGADGLLENMKEFLYDEIINDASDENDITLKSAMETFSPLAENIMLKSINNMWIDVTTDAIYAPVSSQAGEGTDTGLGNAVRGIDALLSGIYEYNKTEAGKIYSSKDSGGQGILEAKTPDGQTIADVLQNFALMLKDYHLEDGTYFGNYQSLRSDGKYFNAEFRNFILEIFPIIQSLMINGKKLGSAIAAESSQDDELDDYPLAMFADIINNDHSKGEKGLDLDIDAVDAAGSVYTMLANDPGMRKRVNRSAIPGSPNYAEKWTQLEKVVWWLFAALDNLGTTAATWDSTDSIEFGDELDPDQPPESGFPRDTNKSFGYPTTPESGEYIGDACSNKKGARPFDIGRGHGMHVPYITFWDGMSNLRTVDNHTLATSLAGKLAAKDGLKYRGMEFDGAYITNQTGFSRNMSGMLTFLGDILPRLAYFYGNPGLELNLFGLFSDRPPGKDTWMSGETFTAADALADDKYNLDIHTNSPVLVLLGGEAKGDVGLPKPTDPLYNTKRYDVIRDAGIEGGRSYGSDEIVPYPETWIDQNNDGDLDDTDDRWARVWVPHTRDGLGVVSTVPWLLTWLIRAGVMGHAPFYSAEDADDLGGGMHRLWAPNGEVYGYVDKSAAISADWIYYGCSDSDPMVRDDLKIHQGNRFKHFWESNHWMAKLEGIDKGTVYTGTHTDGNNVTVLSDNTANWVAGELVGARISNPSSGSSGIVTSNTTNTVSVSWRTSDRYFYITNNGWDYPQWMNNLGWVDIPPVGETFGSENHWYAGNEYRITVYDGEGPARYYTFDQLTYENGSPNKINMDHDIHPGNADSVDPGTGDPVYKRSGESGFQNYHEEKAFMSLRLYLNAPGNILVSGTEGQYIGKALHVPPDSAGNTGILKPTLSYDATNDGVIDDEYLVKVYDSASDKFPGYSAIDDGTGTLVWNREYPSDSGSHTGGMNAGSLTDSSKNWEVDQFVDCVMWNTTGSSLWVVDSNTATTISATQIYGTGGNWDTNDVYYINSIGYVDYSGKIVLTVYPGNWAGTLSADYYRDPLGSTDTDKESKGMQVAELVGGEYMFKRVDAESGDPEIGTRYPYKWVPNDAFDHAKRECATHEEAIYRNLHWWLYEKKYIMSIPLAINMATDIDMPGTLMSTLVPLLMPGCNGTDILIDFGALGAFLGIDNITVGTFLDAMSGDLGDISLAGGAVMAMTTETNGIFGLLNLRRLEKKENPADETGGINGNAKWALADTYDYSTRPADYRLGLMSGGAELNLNFDLDALMQIPFLGWWERLRVGANLNFNDIIDIGFGWEDMFARYGGTLLPAVAMENLDALYSLIYLIPGGKEKFLYGEGGDPINPNPSQILYSTSPELGPKWTAETNPDNQPPASMEAGRAVDGIYWKDRNHVIPIAISLIGAWRDRMSTKPLRNPAGLTGTGEQFEGASAEYPRNTPALDVVTKGLFASFIKPVMYYQNDPVSPSNRESDAPINMWKVELEESTGPPPLYFHQDFNGDKGDGMQSGYYVKDTYNYPEHPDGGLEIDVDGADPNDFNLARYEMNEGTWWLASQADYIFDADYDVDENPNIGPIDDPFVTEDDLVPDPGTFNGYDYDNDSAMKGHFLPKYKKTILGMFAETKELDSDDLDPENPNYLTNCSKDDIDGLITMDTELLKAGIRMIYKLGSSDYDDDLDDDGDIDEYNPDDWGTWGARRKIFFGLEQIMTSIKTTSGDMSLVLNGAPGFSELAHEDEWNRNILLPKCLVNQDASFVIRSDADIDLADILDEFIDNASSDSEKGLAGLPVDPIDQFWTDFDGGILELKGHYMELMTNEGLTGGAYNLGKVLTAVIDEVVEKSDLSIEGKHIQAIRHTAGIAALAYFDRGGSDSWESPGEIKNILEKLPKLIEVFQQHPDPGDTDPEYSKVDGIYAVFKVMLGDLKYDGSIGGNEEDFEANHRWDEGLLKDDGFLEYMLKNMSEDSGSASEYFPELERFIGELGSPYPFWLEISEILREVLDNWEWKDTPYGEYDGLDL